MHSPAWGENMSLLYSDNQGKSSFFFYSGNYRLIFCILKTTSRLCGSSGSHNYSRAYYVSVQKDHRKNFFRSWNEESSLCTPSEATRPSQDIQNEHRSWISENQKLVVYQLDVYWNRPWRVLNWQPSWVELCLTVVSRGSIDFFTFATCDNIMY